MDMNLLRALEALLEERSVTRAAERMGLTQPAMSAALSRLRALFGDPLLVRERRKMVPTHRALQLAGPLSDAMARLRAAIEEGPVFDPRATTRTFHIATSDYGESLVIPSVAAALQKQAPAISLRLTRTEFLYVPPKDALDSGELDFALGFFGLPVTDVALLSQRLFDDRFVCVASKRHPRIRHRLSMQAFLDVPQIRIIYPGDLAIGTVDVMLQSRGLKRNVALTVSHLSTVPHLVAESELIGFVPERMARIAARSLPIRLFTPPIALPPLAITLLWHERRQYDPGHRWLRELITSRAARNR